MYPIDHARLPRQQREIGLADKKETSAGEAFTDYGEYFKFSINHL
jgi:hypothetical protein